MLMADHNESTLAGQMMEMTGTVEARNKVAVAGFDGFGAGRTSLLSWRRYECGIKMSFEFD